MSATHPRNEYAPAWRDRRLRNGVYRAMQIAFVPLLVVLFIIAWSGNARFAAIFGLAAWLAAYATAGLWLNRFRCPRCAGLYYWAPHRRPAALWADGWRACHHCGLQQDARG